MLQDHALMLWAIANKIWAKFFYLLKNSFRRFGYGRNFLDSESENIFSSLNFFQIK